MDASLLHVVTAISNPKRYKSRIRLALEFLDHMRVSGVPVTLVECAYGDRPFDLDQVPGINHVGVRSKTMVWNKENLLNIGISRLPAGWKYLATLDADIYFRRPDWASETVHALQHYDVVQPWSDCYDLGPNDEHITTHRSLLRLWYERKPIVQGPKCGPGGYQFGHPGYAWAWTRNAIEWTGGLVETAALGAADHHMGLALLNKAEESIHGGCTEAYKKPILQWQKHAVQHIAGNVSYMPGTIEHRWHGTKDNRRYVDRWDILVKHKFDPSTDLKRNSYGVFELAGNKPEMRHDMDVYFAQRAEDGNVM